MGLLALLLGPALAPGPATAAPGTDTAAGQAPVSDPASVARAAEEPTPLTVRLLTMSPAVVPRQGAVVLRGVVTNDSDDTWQDVNVLPFVGTSPITDRTELAEQVQLEQTVEVGDRLTDPALFVSLGDLAPGSSTTFRLRLPVDRLPIGQVPGVYWIGAHALGSNADGRDTVADGRARTLIPLLPRAGERTSLALVLPLRDRVRRTPEGRVADREGWAEKLGEDGSLDRLLAFAETGAATPFTWLVDPSVLDAVADLAAGNPEMSLGVPEPEGETDGSGDEPSATDEASPDDGDGERTDGGDEAEEDEVAARARSWLDAMTTSMRGQAVLGLGYGDPDVAALTRHRPGMLGKSLRLAQRRFSARQVDAELAAAPPNGWLSGPMLSALDQVALVLLADHGTEHARTRWSTEQGPGLVMADSRAAEGGPAPAEPLDALPLRQRILADAALRAIDGDESPMPVVLPRGWDPGADWRSADFFDALDQPWLSLVTLDPGATADLPPYDRPLEYPDSERDREVERANIPTAGDLINVGATINDLLATTNRVFDEVLGQALAAVSYSARVDDGRARGETVERATALREQLDQVRVQVGTDFATLSGGEGTLTVALVNELEQPVEVGLAATTSSDDVTVEAPDPVRIGPGERVAVRLRAFAEPDTVGVHEISLSPITTTGRTIGEAETLSLRTSDVGRTIWFILIGMGGLFLVAVVVRIYRRIRGTGGPGGTSGTATGTADEGGTPEGADAPATGGGTLEHPAGPPTSTTAPTTPTGTPGGTGGAP